MANNTWKNYTQKDTALLDNDEIMLLDSADGKNKRGLMSKFRDYVVDKMSTAVISKLETNNKTIIGAINALNSDGTAISDGDILEEKSLINISNHTRNSTMLSFDIITNNIDVEEGSVLCKLRAKYSPKHTKHILGYTYNPKEFIELTIRPNGDIVVFGNHLIKGCKIYFSASYLL